MKKMKTKIILSIVAFLSTVGVVGTLYASGASLYVVPASSSQISGNNFNISAEVSASGNKVCAVEGTLVFNNLSCQNITLSDGVIPQSLPTCSKPYFLIGIPSCTTANQTLFTASVKAGNAGLASVAFTGVDLIGEGASVGSSSVGGNYVISTATKQISTPVTTSNSKSKTVAEKTISETKNQPIKTTEVPVATSTIEKPDAFLAAVSKIITFGTGSDIIGIIVLFTIALFIFLIPSYFEKRRKNK
jgi:hypothetical protein